MATKKNARKTTKKETIKKAPIATKKAAPRKATATRKKEVKETYTPSVVENHDRTAVRPQRSVQMKRSYIIIALSVLVLLGLLYLARSLFIAATVNGQPISRLSVIRDLERQSGKQVLDTDITKTLILQEANKQHVSVSQSEINDEMKRIENNVKQQGQTLDQVLAMQGMDRKTLEDQIRIQKLVEKMLSKSITVSDKEVTDYIDKNQEALGANATTSATRVQVKQQLTQQKLSEKFQTWIQDLKKKAKVDYYVKY